MTLPLPWGALSVEIGCVSLILLIFLTDLLLPQEKKKWIARMPLAGIPILFVLLATQWGTEATVLGGMFRLDALALIFKAIFLTAAFFASLMTIEFLRNREAGLTEFLLLILTALLGMLFLASTYDFILFFISLELVSLSFYVMTAYLRTDERAIEAGIKYLILSSLASGLALYGISLIYGYAGGTGFSELREFIATPGKVPIGFLFGVLLLLSGLGFKVGAVPFHLWIPDVYEGAPLPVTAYLSVGSKAAGFAVVLRLLGEVLEPTQKYWAGLLSLLAAMTILYGNLGAIPQRNVKRLLAFSSIGHAGYLLIGLAAGSRFGSEALLFYLLAYAITNLAAFLAVVLCSVALESDELTSYAGLAERSPFLAAILFVSLLSLAGVPPLAGFFGKFLILASAVDKGLLWLAILGAVNIVISLYYYLMVIKRMYIDKPLDKTTIPVSLPAKVSLAAMILAIVALGVFPWPFLSIASVPATQLF